MTYKIFHIKPVNLPRLTVPSLIWEVLFVGEICLFMCYCFYKFSLGLELQKWLWHAQVKVLDKLLGISAAYQLISPQCNRYQCTCWTKQSVVSGSHLLHFSERLMFCGLISLKCVILGVSHCLWSELSGNIYRLKTFHTLLETCLKPMPGVLHGTNTGRLSVFCSHWWQVCFGHSVLPRVGDCFTRLFTITFFSDQGCLVCPFALRPLLGQSGSLFKSCI